MAKTNTIDMCTGAIFPKMLRFAIPVMLASLLQLLFNAADTVVVGQFCGDVSLAAVSSNGAMVNLLVNLFIGIALGSNVVSARFFATRNDKELSETVHTSMLLALILGVLATIIGLIFSPILLKIMNTPETVLPLATVYLRIYFLCMIPLIVYNFGASILRAVGDTNRPLYYLIAAGVVNVILNLFFVIVFHMDVAGVALATLISQVLSAVLIVRCLMRETGAIRFEPKKMHLYRDKLVQIIRIGFPAGIQSTLFAIANVIIQSAINEFGDMTMAGNGAAASIEGFGYMAMNAFYQAVVSFTGQNFGQRKFDRIVRIQLIGQACAITAGVLFGILCTFFGRELLMIYTDSEEAIAAGLTRLRYISNIYFFCGMMDVLVGGMRGLGSSFLSMVLSILTVCVFRIVWIETVFRVPAYHTMDVLMISYPISWIVTTLLHVVFFVLLLRRLMKHYPA